MKNKLKKMRGQALVENILLIPLLIIVIMALFWFAQMILTKQQLLSAARFGTDLILYSNMNEDQIKQRIRDYLCGNVQGRKLDPTILKDENINVSAQRYGKISPFNANMYKVLNYTASTVDIYYDFNVPPLINVLSRFFGDNWARQNIRVSGHSEVIAGTGCKGDNYQ